jgi:hypothetical protein
MAAPYTSVSITGYNSNPPADDGSAVAANQILWSTIKTKLPDPVKTAVESINSGLVSAFGKIIGGAGVTSTGVSYGVQSSDQGKLVRATAASITITTPDATSVTSPFVFAVLNNSTGTITIDGSGAQTVDGEANISVASGTGFLMFTDGSNWFTNGRFSAGSGIDVSSGVISAALPRGYIDGCILSNNVADATNDLDISAGVCRDSTNTANMTVAAMTKRLDAGWAAGTTNGFRNSAAAITDTTYHVYSVSTAAGVQDFYAHTSTTVATVITALQAESGGTDYIYARRIGSITRSTSIRPFVQDGDEFLLKTPLNSYSSTNPGTSAVTYTVVGVPTGVKMGALLNGYARFATTGNGIYRVFSSDETDAAVDATNMTGREATDDYSSFMLTIRTNTSAQAKFRFSVSAGSDAMNINCRGWIDSRGKDA